MNTSKLKIQYVGQFYVYGSEAPKIEPQPKKKPRTVLPLAKLEKIEKIYVDPVALVAMAVAVFMLITMVVGMVQLRDDWAQYQQMRTWVHELKTANHEKTEAFRASYDLRDIQAKALAMGMIPKAQAESRVLKVTLPEPEPEATLLEEIRWFVTGLFA